MLMDNANARLVSSRIWCRRAKSCILRLRVCVYVIRPTQSRKWPAAQHAFTVRVCVCTRNRRDNDLWKHISLWTQASILCTNWPSHTRQPKGGGQGNSRGASCARKACHFFFYEYSIALERIVCCGLSFCVHNIPPVQLLHTYQWLMLTTTLRMCGMCAHSTPPSSPALPRYRVTAGAVQHVISIAPCILAGKSQHIILLTYKLPAPW